MNNLIFLDPLELDKFEGQNYYRDHSIKYLKVQEYIFLEKSIDNLFHKMMITNSFKLKKQFKMVFNTSVFHYLTELRMEYAKQLILEEEYSVALVSEELGYKNPQHFTVAFKKIFGYLPSKLKKIV